MRLSIAILIAGLVFCESAHADVKLPALFGDHMVLQQAADATIWGWAAPGETVSASIAGQKVGAVAGPDGKWTIRFAPIRSGNEPIELSVIGKNTITIHDVLVGDVWLASGQSNMEFALKGEKNGKEEVPKANHPKIRFFRVPYLLSNDPKADCDGKWELCTPESAAEFSAVAYYFAVDLQKKLDVPIGIIGSYRGGSIAQGWISIDGFRSQENLKSFVEDYETSKVKSVPAMLKYEQAVAKWEQAQKDWDEKWKAAEAEGKLAPPKPKGKKPENRALIYSTPTLMYNAMTAPLVPYSIKGVIYYQGESDAHKMEEIARYQLLFPTLIKDWRRLWNATDLPFLYVQLPNYRKRAPEPGDSVWAAMREVQAKTLDLPRTGMAVTIDLGDIDKPDNIHPPDKLDVAKRLSLVAQQVTYGKEIDASGPTFEKLIIDGSKARVTFKHIGGGLVIGASPVQSGPPTEKLAGFAIAGADKQFVWADAKIDGAGSVVVWSDKVSAPVAVRYGWSDNPEVNLYNQQKLPAAPFRTDDWTLNDPPPAVKPAK